MSKLVIGWFFGGRSTEHEVSVVTAIQAYENLDKDKYEVVPVYVSKSGQFYSDPKFLDLKTYKDIDSFLLSQNNLLPGTKNNQKGLVSTGMMPKIKKLDLAFPLFHGSFGEDGCVQGLFEMYQIPYVGFNVLGSAVSMDKILQKQLFQSLGLPICKYATITRSEFQKNSKHLRKLLDKLNFPLFVKPATIGSSIGVQKAKNFDELSFAIEVAATYSEKILIEEDLSGLVEVNCSALGYSQSLKLPENKEVQASVCEMPKATGEILSFQDKYQRGGKGKGSSAGMASLQRIIPAPIKAHLAQQIQNATLQIFKALDGCGVARVDFFVDEKKEKFYVNEINTPPGSLAYYLWEKTEYYVGNNPIPLKGIPYKKLLDFLIEFALERAENQKKTQYTFESGLLGQMAGSGGLKG